MLGGGGAAEGVGSEWRTEDGVEGEYGGGRNDDDRSHLRPRLAFSILVFSDLMILDPQLHMGFVYFYGFLSCPFWGFYGVCRWIYGDKGFGFEKLGERFCCLEHVNVEFLQLIGLRSSLILRILGVMLT